MNAALLDVRNVSRQFGGLKATDDVSFTLNEGEIVGLIGSNGAGKTTLVNLVTGHLKPSRGTMSFRGENITGHKPHELARRGLMRTFQIVQPFNDLTARDNVAAAAMFAGHTRSFAGARERADESLDSLGIGHCRDHLPVRMTLAERKRLELARAWVARPKLLFLDEVNAGLNSGEIEGVLGMIRKIAAEGVAIVIIEHLMKVVRGLCPRLIVLHRGQLLASGPTDEVARNPAVIEAYLGTRGAAAMLGEKS
ncbi:ABC transporter ATP-binding protein [Bradyrhizobium sp. USDA 3364]